LVWLAILAAAPSAHAHRTDEYLQATRISVDVDHADLEIDLTPGIALASTVFSWIDTNGDGGISSAEGDAYARQVLRSVTLSVDSKPVPLTLVESSFPAFREMNLGVGTIRLRITAKFPAVRTGRHRIAWLNTHRPESSVYLVNALVPGNPHIQLTDQERDREQHGLTLDYTVAADSSPVWKFALIGGVVLAGRSFLRLRRRSAAA
jgi:hypothetical protein